MVFSESYSRPDSCIAQRLEQEPEPPSSTKPPDSEAPEVIAEQTPKSKKKKSKKKASDLVVTPSESSLITSAPDVLTQTADASGKRKRKAKAKSEKATESETQPEEGSSINSKVTRSKQSKPVEALTHPAGPRPEGMLNNDVTMLI